MSSPTEGPNESTTAQSADEVETVRDGEDDENDEDVATALLKKNREELPSDRSSLLMTSSMQISRNPISQSLPYTFCSTGIAQEQ